MIRKTGWRGGPEVLIVEAADREAMRLHELLAGNQRLEYLCGYHWAVDFEYGVGSVETIAINENCESFRRNGKEIRQLLTGYFKKAATQPSHHLVRVVARDRKTKAALERHLEAHFGPTFDTNRSGTTLVVASPEPWTRERLSELRASSEWIAAVTEIESYDMGS